MEPPSTRRRKTALIFLVISGLTALSFGSAKAIEGIVSQGGGYGAWAPGIAAPVAAIDRAPRVSTVPSEVQAAVRRAAADTGGRPDHAVASLRTLRDSLGMLKSNLYVFQPSESGAVCMMLSGRMLGCPTLDSSPLPGVMWQIAGGFPAIVDGIKVDVPSALYGIAADNVRRVSLVVDGSARDLTITSNAFYVELVPPATTGTAPKLELRVSYAGGVEKTVAMPGP
jgi:hypothetical protein